MGLPFAAAAKGAASNQWVGQAIAAGVQSGGGIFSALVAKKANKQAWKRSVAHEQKVWERDSAYNSPAAQMERLKAAGLNPNLMYGQGTMGNTEGKAMQSDSFMRGAEPFMAMTVGAFQEGLMFAAELRKRNNEADLVGNRNVTETAKQELMQAQNDLVRSNPYMRPQYVDALVKQLEATAALKDQEARFNLSLVGEGHPILDRTGQQEIGFVKMDQELQRLFQKYNLNEADQAIKARIIESKGFENDLKEIQTNWMKNADITPQHIYTGIMLILQRLMR